MNPFAITCTAKSAPLTSKREYLAIAVRTGIKYHLKIRHSVTISAETESWSKRKSATTKTTSTPTDAAHSASSKKTITAPI